MSESRSIFHVAGSYQPLVRQVGIDAESVFDDPRIVVWRDIIERQNCTLDEMLGDGRKVRLHIKRFKRAGDSGAEAEVDGIRLLQSHGIATVPLVGWGRSPDGRGFVISEDLAGYQAGDKAVEAGMPIDRLLAPVAAVAGRLHREGLHHRDLYLCHFFVKAQGDDLDVRLIDAARVRPLPRFWLRRRWIVKDMAQLLYSLQQAGATTAQQAQLFELYAEARGEPVSARFWRQVHAKARRIGRHDARLKQKQPGRDVSLNAMP